MAPYTTVDAIEAALGVTFTPEQAAQASQVVVAVTSFIDGYTGRSWQGTSPVAGELANVLPAGTAYPAAFGIVYLAHRPAESVTAVVLRSGYPNATETALTTDQFELIDGPAGLLTLTGGYSYAYPDLLAVVDYTYADAVPADITLAATMIASGVMARTLAVQAGSAAIAAHPELAGLESVAVGQNDVSVKLSSAVTSGSGAASGSAAGSSWAAPGSAVAGLLDPYRRPVIA